MIDTIVSLTNVRVAGDPTFFPGADPGKHRCLVTVIKNRGKNKAGQEMTDEFTLVFWAKYAQTAAMYLDKGRAIDVTGVLRSHTIDTGRIKPNGKKELNRTTNIHVKSFEFGADSKKELVKRVGQNIAKAIQEGLLPPNCTITPDYLIAVSRAASYDYNPQLAAQTGRYGNARVFIKGQGFLGNGAVAQPAIVADDELARMEAQVAQMKAAKAAGAEINPFGA
ncbi:MAG: single-stranded DNA-binding protein [Sedimentisphaerales bacterium]